MNSKYSYGFSWTQGRFLSGHGAERPLPWDRAYAKRVFEQNLAEDDHFNMVALDGPVESPSTRVIINTRDGYFHVDLLDGELNPWASCSFRLIDRLHPDDFQFPTTGWSDLVRRRPNQLMLSNVGGVVEKDEQMASLKLVIRTDAYVRTVAQIRGTAKAEIREFEPCPALGSDQIWYDYPRFDDYEELIRAARSIAPQLLRG